MRILYTLGINLYTLGIRVAAICGHTKARQMVNGWHDWRRERKKWKVESGEWVWFHAASLGEFEQARPVLETYRQRHRGCRVLVTFFSPSGYEVRKNYPLADHIIYLPPDTPCNVCKLLDTYNPKVAFFVKYEFWYNYLGELRRRGIPTYIFSTIFRPEQYFFKWYGGWFRKQLRTCFKHLFVQNEESLYLLKSHGIDQCSLAGDTRFDRVHQIAQAAEPDTVAEQFLDGHEGKVLVAGSTWPPDEQLIAKLKVEDLKLKVILAPHVIGEEHLQAIEKLFPDSVRYSAIKDHKTPKDLKDLNVLIIDNIGLLSKLYRYADVAYIGGGFGVGIHNILEAVTFGKPVFFGPNYHKFQEAKDITALGGGWSILSEHDMKDGAFMQLLSHPESLQHASQACTYYMQKNLGSTDIILRTIEN